MKKRCFLIWVIAAATAGPSWALGPQQGPNSVRLLSSHPAIGSLPPARFHNAVVTDWTAKTLENKNTAANRSQAWRRFASRAGPGWSVRWNRLTGTAHSAAGPAVALEGVSELTKNNLEPACLDFVAAQARLLGIEPQQLRMANATKAGGRWHAMFQQTHKGIPVLGGQVRMSFSRDDRLVMFGSDVFPNVEVETEPKLRAKQALALARADSQALAGTDRISEPQLNILALYRPDGFDYLLCWKLSVFQPTIPKRWQYLIDAHTGHIVGKRDVLVYENVTGTVQGEYKPEFGGEPTYLGVFPHQNVSVHGPVVEIASWNFDSDPCWSSEGLWQFSPPNDGEFEFCPGPNSAYTGDNVYGYNLFGDYPNNIDANYLTTTPIDCSAYDDVHLRFMRWLGVESSWWDKASIEVSNDANKWTTVWENPASTVCDGQWVRASYDISEVAASQATVYVRWAMGPIDSYLEYPGWYIDDVKVVSISAGINTVQTQPDGSYSVPLPWSPSTISSELKGLYCDISHECVPDAWFEQPQVYPLDVADFSWTSNWYNGLVESNMYWHHNMVHDYFAALDPALSQPSRMYPSGLDYPMPVRVQLGCFNGFCNAYWDTRGMGYGAGNGIRCDDFGLYAEVVYHEYTHAVTSKVYDGIPFMYFMEPGAMNEAWSDYFAHLLSPSQSPLIGDGGLFLNLPEGFRTLDNNYRRETDFSNSVHFDSQMLSGSLWEIRQVIDQQLDVEDWDQVIHFAKYAHPQSFEEYLFAVLAEDDSRYGDSYPANATPHAQTIHSTFGNHGIGGLQYLAPSIVVADYVGNTDGKLDPGETANFSLSLTNGWADATNISAVLTTEDPFVTVVKDSVGFGDVEHGGITDNGADPFVITLDPACPGTHTIDFTLQISADGPYSYSRTCLLTYSVAFRQLVYDDGRTDYIYLGFGLPDSGLAVRMTPQSYPCYPMSVRLFPNPDTDSTTTVTIWDDDGPGQLPGTILGEVPTEIRAVDGWFDVDISFLDLTIDSGSFYVGWIEGQSRYYNGIDQDPPYYQRSWAYLRLSTGGLWMSFLDAAFLGNLMLRVGYFYTSADGPVENLTSGKRYDYIQYAIYDANDGDQIVVSQGTHNENINFLGRAITIRSEDPNDSAVVAATIIHGRHRRPAVTFSSGETPDCLLAGFTITGAHKGAANKGAISCVDLGQTGPTIRNCVITENDGPGLWAAKSSPRIINCKITANDGDGIDLRSNSYPTIANCIIAHNLGHGIRGGWPTITNSTIMANVLSGISRSQATVANSIIWNNAEAQIDGDVEATYCDVKGGWPGLGNIDVDPCFVDANAGDYHFKSQGWRWDPDANQWTQDQTTSRCIDAGNPGSVLGGEPVVLDVDPLNRFGQNLRINMGAYGGREQASMPPHGWAILSDLTNDGVVDFVDLAHWSQYWLTGGTDLPADSYRSDFVDMADFASLTLDWDEQTTWHK